MSLVKSFGNWLFYDDENVEAVDESMVQNTFGSTSDMCNNMDHGYILMYEKVKPESIANGDAGGAL